MTRKITAPVVVLFVLSVLCALPAFGQATFTVGASSTPGADIGAAEPAGMIRLTVLSGTTVAAPMAVHYSSPISNNKASEIVISGTGGLRLVTPTPVWDTASNTIIIAVPAGGIRGDQLNIKGVRISLLGNTDNRVTAKITGLTAGGNSITVGQNLITVIDRIIPPYVVDWTSSRPISWENGFVTNAGSSFSVTETYEGAFTSSVGPYGQTTPTLIRITPFPSLPPGIRLTFAAAATSQETAAYFSTLSGSTEVVPRADGTTDVVYKFIAAPESGQVLETFPFSVSVDVRPPATTGTLYFQTALLPIGTFPTSTQFPSTAIPRYTERLVPDESELIVGQTELAFPFSARSSGTFTGIALTNLLPYRVNVMLAAYDSTGKIILGRDINNPALITLPRRGQYAKIATEIFGNGFNTSTFGTIRATGQTPLMTGFYLTGDTAGPRLDGATGDISPLAQFIFTNVARQGPSPFTTIELFNQGTSQATMVLKLRDSEGQLMGTSTQTVGAGATSNRELAQLFPSANPGSFSGGYIEAAADAAIVVRETFGSALESNVLTGEAPFQALSFDIPHFASGGGYSTEITLVNADTTARDANLTLTLHDNSGTAIQMAGNPAHVTVPPGKQLIQTLESLFPGLGAAALTTGYVHVDVASVRIGPYDAVPLLAGSIRFSAADGYASAALPLRSLPSSNLVYSHVAQNADYYTGVAVLNSNPGPAGISLDVYSEGGTFVGTYSATLLANQKISKLLYEVIPATAGQVGGYVRVRSTVPITSFALFGTNNGKSLSAIPPQDAGDY